jgi:DNA-binding MarR family transcriptional regulator
MRARALAQLAARRVVCPGGVSLGLPLVRWRIVVHYQRQDDACLHAISAMAKLAGIPTPTFKKWIAELREAGLIETTRHKRTGAARHATITAGNRSPTDCSAVACILEGLCSATQFP